MVPTVNIIIQVFPVDDDKIIPVKNKNIIVYIFKSSI